MVVVSDPNVHHSPASDPSEYFLKVDEQAQEFIKTRQQLTYFLITASSAVIAFLISFVFDQEQQVSGIYSLVLLAALLGLVCSGTAILALYFELDSTRSHLRARYKKQSYDELNEAEQGRWDKAVRISRRGVKWALGALFLEILFSAAVLTGLLFASRT